jgi:hypothetical protein
MRNLFALVLILVVAMTGGAAILLSETTMSMPAPNVPGTGSFIRGVVVDVDTRSLNDVRAFTLRLGDKTYGETFFEFQVGELENADEFPPSHILEHQATAQPVTVYYRLEGDVRFAVRIEDGGG